MDPRAWLTNGPEGRITLICFPFAGGGGHSYASWRPYFEPDIALRAVSLPGRGMRLMERPITSWQTLRSKLAEVIRPLTSKPYAFFGHSMGALIAYDLARTIQDDALPMPACLFLSGHPPPHLTATRESISRLDDDAFLRRIREFNGAPAKAMDNHELMSLMLPALRSDMQLTETYDRNDASAIDVPIITFAGRSDKFAVADEVAQWSRYTKSTSFCLEMPGDHFFIFSEDMLVPSGIRKHLMG